MRIPTMLAGLLVVFAVDRGASQDAPAPRPVEPDVEALVDELRNDSALQERLRYVQGLRVDQLFDAQGSFEFIPRKGFVPSKETWQRWATKLPRNQRPEVSEESYQDFLKYLPALAKAEWLSELTVEELEDPGKTPEELTKELQGDLKLQREFFYTNQPVYQMFRRKDGILVTPGGGFLPTQEGWAHYVRSVPPKQRVEPSQANYRKFLRYAPALQALGALPASRVGR